MINLASTESYVDKDSAAFATLENFEKALGENSAEISPAMIYAYAAVGAGVGYGNFTPSGRGGYSRARRIRQAKRRSDCGKDGKTGQTFIKTVIAPGLKGARIES
jgi:myo-inositol-1-phosphate synthase